MDIDNFFKRYVWDDGRTPYFVPLERLNRKQAGYELQFYALFAGVLFAVVAIAALSKNLPHGSNALVSIYAFTVACASLVLGLTQHPWAALYTVGAPVAALGYFAVYGFHPNLGAPDKVVLVTVMIGWLAYGRRVVAVANVYPTLPEAPPPDKDEHDFWSRRRR